MVIDLNADVGESFGRYTLGADDELLAIVTSANVACGAHAGDPQVMRRTVRLAVRHGVAVGAHPGFFDLQGFGRREMALSPEEVEDAVLYQLGALAGVAAAEGARLTHVKPHGALYNMAARDRALADAIARAVAAFDRSLVLVGLAGSALLTAGRAAGLSVAAEAFADRAYEPDGSLASRRRPGSVLQNVDEVAARAVRLVREHRVQATDGSTIVVEADTICIHGDTPGAVALARAVRRALEANGIDVRAFASR
ncbi:MAG TPA: 5-oxoprolinase subunit PxpA [Vicinamibacterales bacterium]|nr:5-oxoprolinase subunit PxpA [Vicinamibacterales bacterium]